MHTHARASPTRLSGHHTPFVPRRRMVEPAPPGRATGQCFAGLCATGGLAADSRSCCPLACRRCGGPGCGLLEHGPGAMQCCPARWLVNASGLCADPGQSHCRMPPQVATCLNKLKGTPSHVRPTSLTARPGERDPRRACRCHGPHSRAYRGQCVLVKVPWLAAAHGATHRSRNPPACSELPSRPERSALAAWMPNIPLGGVRSGACLPSPMSPPAGCTQAVPAQLHDHRLAEGGDLQATLVCSCRTRHSRCTRPARALHAPRTRPARTPHALRALRTRSTRCLSARPPSP